MNAAHQPMSGLDAAAHCAQTFDRRLRGFSFMGDPSQRDQNTLRAKARDRIDCGLLPRTKAARTWGGRGSGHACSLCDAPILESEPEMELEYEEPSSNAILRFHLQCQSIWEAERHGAPADAWRQVENDLPPFGRTVETRVELGGGRSVILNVMRLCDSESGSTLWINANTNAPLPETWRPVAWRDPARQSPPEPAGTQPGAASRRA